MLSCPVAAIAEHPCSASSGYKADSLQCRDTCMLACVAAAGLFGHLHGAQQRDGGGVVDDALPKHQVEQQRRPVLFQHRQHRHAVRRREDGPQRQAVLPQQGKACCVVGEFKGPGAFKPACMFA